VRQIKGEQVVDREGDKILPSLDTSRIGEGVSCERGTPIGPVCRVVSQLGVDGFLEVFGAHLNNSKRAKRVKVSFCGWAKGELGFDLSLDLFVRDVLQTWGGEDLDGFADLAMFNESGSSVDLL
jgi:hypothetical protein